MSGLDLSKDKIIEIAIIITDGTLENRVLGPELIINQSKELMNSMDKWCTHTHRESGLTQKVLNSSITMGEAETMILSFIEEHIPDKKVGILAGNSVHVDRQFLQKDMPLIADHLHYRIVDVSTIKELVRRWYPAGSIQPPHKKLAHRAREDIEESIEELIFYRSNYFKSS